MRSVEAFLTKFGLDVWSFNEKHLGSLIHQIGVSFLIGKPSRVVRNPLCGRWDSLQPSGGFPPIRESQYVWQSFAVDQSAR